MSHLEAPDEELELPDEELLPEPELPDDAEGLAFLAILRPQQRKVAIKVLQS
jgi:hypothetical protein